MAELGLRRGQAHAVPQVRLPLPQQGPMMNLPERTVLAGYPLMNLTEQMDEPERAYRQGWNRAVTTAREEVAAQADAPAERKHTLACWDGIVDGNGQCICERNDATANP